MSVFLERELKWIKDVQVLSVLNTLNPPSPYTLSHVFQVMYEKGEGGQLDAPLIEGHLNLTVELISALPIGEKFVVGSKEGGVGLIKVSANTDSHQI